MFEGTGLGDPFIYWTLRFLLLGVLVYSGWGISYDNPQKFKKYAWTAGVVYSLVEGLRFMRGMDYYHYYNDIVTLFGNYGGIYGRGTITRDPEFLYDCWVTVFYYSGLPFWIAFVMYSAILICAVLLLLKHFSKVAVWALPLFFIITVNQTENLIRQFLAASFLIFAYYFYLERKKKWMWIMLSCVPFIHFSGIIAEIIFLVFIYTPNSVKRVFNNRILLWVLLGIFVYTYFFWDQSNLQGFADFIGKNIRLDDEEKGASYIDNADRWFTDEGSISMLLYGKVASTIGFVNNVVKFISNGIIVWIGFFVKKYDSRLIVAYFFSYLAILMSNVGGDIEMFQRFHDWFYLFTPLMLGCIIINKSISFFLRNIIIVMLSLNFCWYGFLSFILRTSIFGYGFIWDADVNIWWR